MSESWKGDVDLYGVRTERPYPQSSMKANSNFNFSRSSRFSSDISFPSKLTLEPTGRKWTFASRNCVAPVLKCHSTCGPVAVRTYNTRRGSEDLAQVIVICRPGRWLRSKACTRSGGFCMRNGLGATCQLIETRPRVCCSARGWASPRAAVDLASRRIHTLP